jgi:electron transfer flavoprotein beta subunit
MKILVPIKRVVDYNVKVLPKSDGSDVELSNVKMTINPFCEIAIEEAVRIKEKYPECEVVVVSIGEPKAQDQLRTALALGADKAILVETDASLEPLSVAKYLNKIVEQEQPQLVIMGKQAIDGDNNQTGQMLAALCGWPQGTFCSRIIVKDENIEVRREIDGGIETLELKLPAVVTADLRLNEPRYVSLPNMMKAKKKPITVIPAENLQVDSKLRLTLLSVAIPAPRKTGTRVANVMELFEKLKNEAKVI